MRQQRLSLGAVDCRCALVVRARACRIALPHVPVSSWRCCSVCDCVLLPSPEQHADDNCTPKFSHTEEEAVGPVAHHLEEAMKTWGTAGMQEAGQHRA